MKYATFFNFTDKPFTHEWNGKAYTFQPGAKKERLNATIAAFFAKHLANKVLTETDKEQYCSPKKPLEVPQFMEVFNKAYFLEADGREVDPDTGLPADESAQPSMNVRTVPRETIDPYDANAKKQFGPGGKPQVIGVVTDDESSFEGKQEGGEDEIE